MVKTQVCINVDYEVINEFKHLFPNQVSSFCNEQMRIKIGLTKNNTEQIDILLAEKKLDKISKKVDELAVERVELAEKIRFTKENQEKIAEDRDFDQQ